MKKGNIFLLLILGIIVYILIFYNDKITSNLSKIISQDYKKQVLTNNKYSKNDTFEFFDIPKDNVPLSYKEIIGVIYSAVNAKEEKYTFYCPSEYSECIKDVEEITDNSLLLTHLNNFVHPYNSFTNLVTSISESGEITLSIKYLYNNEEISEINAKIDKIFKKLKIDEEQDEYEKIKKIHDYVIDNTKYDIERNDNGDSSHSSFKASGALIEGFATCNGYADSMAIILSKLGYKNYKIATTPEEISYSSTGHVWNGVFFDNKWVHIDLTWDDPVSDDGKDYLYHKYFLVTTEEMHEADSGDVTIEEHNFNDNIYSEFKLISESK